MVSTYLLYCRALILLVFAVSLIAKTASYSTFHTTLMTFGLGRVAARVGAGAALVGELGVASSMLFPGRWLVGGFGLTLFVLVVFTLAILSMLRSGAAPSCGCFGSTNHPLGYEDVARNVFLIVCTTVALSLSWSAGVVSRPSPDAGTVVALGGAIVSGLMVIGLRDLVELWR